jgi:hypothetical protein
MADSFLTIGIISTIMGTIAIVRAAAAHWRENSRMIANVSHADLSCWVGTKIGPMIFARFPKIDYVKPNEPRLDAFETEGGAETQNRTADTRLFRPLLYRLSYLGTGEKGNTTKERMST